MPEHHDGLPYLREMLIFLALSGVLIPLLQRYRVNQMLGFLATGVLLGPSLFGLLAPECLPPSESGDLWRSCRVARRNTHTKPH